MHNRAGTGGTPPQRTVEVVNPRAGVRGSGCLIAPGLILAAGHIACPNRDSGPVVIRALEGGTEHDAEVLWHDASLDVALLRADRTRLGTELGIVRWGALTGDHPDPRPETRPVCTTIGFPQALHRKVPGGPRFATQAQSLDGHIAPRGRARSGMYVFELADPDAVSFDLWEGMSGAAVYCDDSVVGVATNAADYWRGETLLVLPAFRLLSAPGFADAVASATGMRPALRPADLAPLLTGLPEPQLSASYLLQPAARVVPMSGDAGTMQALRGWCFNGRRTDVAALTGADGVGKTRLAYELLGHLAREVRGRPAWTGGFLAEVPRDGNPGYALFTTVRQPLLVIVDGAEARLDQVHAMFDVLGNRRSGQPVRVLLIVRGREDWWPRLRATWTGSIVMGRGDTYHVAAGDALSDVGAEAVYARALRAYADRIRIMRAAGIDDDRADRADPDLGGPRRYTVPTGTHAGLTVASLHMAALADVLTRYAPELAVHRRPLDVLLHREDEHAQRIALARMPSGLVDTGLLRTLLAVQQLAGARTVDDALAAVRAGFEVHNRGRGDLAQPHGPVLHAYESILATAYPSGHGARWGSIGPEPLGAALVAEVEASGGGHFLGDLLRSPHLSALQRYRALTVLVRTVGTQPELVASAARAVASAPDLLLPIAEWIPAETSAARALEWLTLCRDAIEERALYGDLSAETTAWARWAVESAIARLRAEHGDFVEAHATPYEGVFVPRPRGPFPPAGSGSSTGERVAAGRGEPPGERTPGGGTPGVGDRRDGGAGVSGESGVHGSAGSGWAVGSPGDFRASGSAGSGRVVGEPGVSGASGSAAVGSPGGPGISGSGRAVGSPRDSGTSGGAAGGRAADSPGGRRTSGSAARGRAAGDHRTSGSAGSVRGTDGSRGVDPAEGGSGERRTREDAGGRGVGRLGIDPSARGSSTATGGPARDRDPLPQAVRSRPGRSHAESHGTDRPTTSGPRHGGAHRHRAPRRVPPAHGLRQVAVEAPRPGAGRALLTLLGLAYLALVAYAACDTFYFTGRFAENRLAWIFPPIVLLVDIEAALQSRHWQGRPELTDLPAQFLAVAVTTASGAMYAGNQFPDTNAALLALLTGAAAVAGTALLTAAVRRWFGQVGYVRDSVVM